MGLVLEVRRGEDEVLRDDGELVQDKVVSRPQVSDLERRWRVLEGIKGLVRLGRVAGRTLGLVGQCWGEAKLELQVVRLAQAIL